MIVFLVGNTSWKRWKCHLRDSRFQNFLRGWGGLLFFISNLNWLIINSTVLFKKWDPLEFLWGKAIFGNVKRLNLFCFRGLCPLDPQRGSAPVPRLGPRQPPNTSPVERLPAPIAVYFQNISTYFKSYWQPIYRDFQWGKVGQRYWKAAWKPSLSHMSKLWHPTIKIPLEILQNSLKLMPSLTLFLFP